MSYAIPESAGVVEARKEALAEAAMQIGAAVRSLHRAGYHDTAKRIAEFAIESDVCKPEGRVVQSGAAAPPQEPPHQNTTYERWLKVVAFHRDMAARFAEDCDALKHRVRELEAELAVARGDAIPQEPSEDIEVLRRALGNCYMMAKREIARILNGKSQTDATSLERWRHVQRFCEETGMKSSILRATLPTEITDGGAAGPQEPPPQDSSKLFLAAEITRQFSVIDRLHNERDELERTLVSIAVMLGWGNLPPRETLERDIAALKARARGDAARVPPSQPETFPIPLNAEQEKAIKEWAADDRLWTIQETVEFNLRPFARTILKLARVPPATPPHGWQPIETAPEKEYVAILLRLSNGCNVIGHRYGRSWIHTFDGTALRLPATHWMPLPDPPATPAQEQP